MKPEEQAAFVEAYANHVADVSSDLVADFVRRYFEGAQMDYSHEYTSIMDALGMWNEGIKWEVEQMRSALRLAGKTAGDEQAITAVERVLQ